MRRTNVSAKRGQFMVEERYFDAYEIGTGQETIGRTITEADIVFHAGQTGDFFPHHMDAKWCEASGLGGRIAHGTLVLSVGVGLTASVINPHAMSYGYDRIRFVKPVFIGDTIHAKTWIKEKRGRPNDSANGVVVEGVEIINQYGDVVMALDHLYLVKREGCA